MSRKKIKDVARVIDSLHDTPDYVDDGFPMVRVVDVNDNFLHLEKCLRVDNETCDRHNKNHIPKYGDIVITRVGSYGMVAYVNTHEKFCLGQNIAIISPYNNNKFIYYYLQSPYMQNYIYSVSGGSSYKCIGLEDIKEFPYDEDNLNCQKIGDILYTIDSKIENNNRINDHLESLAKIIYDYWFLQFDFTNEEGKPYKSSGGKMVWNEELKREIPEGWEVTKLGKECVFKNGINYDKNEIGDKQYKIVNVRNITTSTLFLDAESMDNISLKSIQADKYIVGEYDILIARSGTPGATRLLLDVDNTTIFCGFIISATPVNKDARLFLTYTIKQLEGSNATTTGGSIMQNVSQDTLKQIVIYMPDNSVIKKFNEKINPILEKFRQVLKENRELMSLRDFLLPMLMSGQVGFKESDR